MISVSDNQLRIVAEAADCCQQRHAGRFCDASWQRCALGACLNNWPTTAAITTVATLGMIRRVSHAFPASARALAVSRTAHPRGTCHTRRAGSA